MVNKTPDGKSFAKDLAECRKQLEKQRSKQAAELKEKKIVEVQSDKAGFKKVAIEEDSDDSDDKEVVKQLKKDNKKTKTIDEETLKRA